MEKQGKLTHKELMVIVNASLTSPKPDEPKPEIAHCLNLAQAELRSCYKRLGFNNSNILSLIDEQLYKLLGENITPLAKPDTQEGGKGDNLEWLILDFLDVFHDAGKCPLTIDLAETIKRKIMVRNTPPPAQVEGEGVDLEKIISDAWDASVKEYLHTTEWVNGQMPLTKHQYIQKVVSLYKNKTS